MLTFLVPREKLDFVLLNCSSYAFLSWYEDETSYINQLDEQGFPMAAQFFVEVYVQDDSLIEILKDFPVKRSPLPSVDLASFDISKKIGDFWINPQFCENKSLYVRAATAFGSGEHQTTSACLKAISDLTYHPKRILDLGCGSGILAIACSKKWPHAHIDASDFDPESVRVTRQNAQNNGHIFPVYESCGFAHRKIQQTYDLVVANILSTPLIQMAKDMKKYAPNTVILSGLLKQQKERVLHAYRLQGFFIQRLYQEKEWMALVLKKKN